MVSVIIPVYNVEKYVADCIESVMAQTYSDWEMILVDDGSKDNSAAICKEYASKDSRIKFLQQENKGLSGARNTGVKASTGDFVFFVDSDDCIDCRLLETVVKLADDTKAGLVQINLKFVQEDFKTGSQICSDIQVQNNELSIDSEKYSIQTFDVIQAFYNLDKDNKRYAKDIRLATTVAWTKLYRRSVFKELLFPEEVRLHEDQMTAHRRIVESSGMVFVDVPLYYYRQAGKESLIRTGWNVRRLSILDCYDDRLKCAVNLNELKKTKESKELLDYIYLRTLICHFRNYCMIQKNVLGPESVQYKKDVKSRIRVLLADKPGKISAKYKLFFNAFIIWPWIFAKAFIIRNK